MVNPGCQHGLRARRIEGDIAGSQGGQPVDRDGGRGGGWACDCHRAELAVGGVRRVADCDAGAEFGLGHALRKVCIQASDCDSDDVTRSGGCRRNRGDLSARLETDHGSGGCYAIDGAGCGHVVGNCTC